MATEPPRTSPRSKPSSRNWAAGTRPCTWSRVMMPLAGPWRKSISVCSRSGAPSMVAVPCSRSRSVSTISSAWPFSKSRPSKARATRRLVSRPSARTRMASFGISASSGKAMLTWVVCRPSSRVRSSGRRSNRCSRGWRSTPSSSGSEPPSWKLSSARSCAPPRSRKRIVPRPSSMLDGVPSARAWRPPSVRRVTLLAVKMASAETPSTGGIGASHRTVASTARARPAMPRSRGGWPSGSARSNCQLPCRMVPVEMFSVSHQRGAGASSAGHSVGRSLKATWSSASSSPADQASASRRAVPVALRVVGEPPARGEAARICNSSRRHVTPSPFSRTSPSDTATPAPGPSRKDCSGSRALSATSRVPESVARSTSWPVASRSMPACSMRNA